jgi:hypothetical protein
MRAAKGEIKPKETIDRTVSDWNATIKKLGADKQKAFWQQLIVEYKQAGVWPISPVTQYPMESRILADVWQWTPFFFLTLLTAISAVPGEPFEAARVDGASSLQQIRRLTIPKIHARSFTESRLMKRLTISSQPAYEHATRQRSR